MQYGHFKEEDFFKRRWRHPLRRATKRFYRPFLAMILATMMAYGAIVILDVLYGVQEHPGNNIILACSASCHAVVVLLTSRHFRQRLSHSFVLTAVRFRRSERS